MGGGKEVGHVYWRKSGLVSLERCGDVSCRDGKVFLAPLSCVSSCSVGMLEEPVYKEGRRKEVGDDCLESLAPVPEK